jgi:hypothetical protein
MPFSYPFNGIDFKIDNDPAIWSLEESFSSEKMKRKLFRNKCKTKFILI